MFILPVSLKRLQCVGLVLILPIFAVLAGCGGGSTSMTAPTKTLSSIAITPGSATIATGATEQFSATGTYSDGSKATLTSYVTWTVSKSSVATISATGAASGVAVGSSEIKASLNGVSSTATLTVKATAPTLTSVTVIPDTANITAGTSQQFTATANYSDGTTANVSSSATWKSSDAAIASISGTGLATALSAGTTTVTASVGTVSGSAALTVTAGASATVTSIAVTPASDSLTVGATQQYAATATYSDGTTANVTSTVTWKSSNIALATVNAAGFATAVAAGSVSITASLSGVTGTAPLTITAPTVSSIAISPATASVAAGGTQQYMATATYSNGTTGNVTSTATWKSSNTALATVNAAGFATAVAAGSVSITASLSGVTGTAPLTITAPTVSSIAISPATASVAAGGTQQYMATATYSNGTTGNVTSTATWKTSNSSVASITQTGLAGAVAPGSASITATVNGVTGTAALTVTAATVSSIAVTPSSASIATGSTQQFTATATYSNGTTGNVTSSVTWVSSNPSIVTISAGGLATAVASGSASISAMMNGVTGMAPLTVTVASISSIAVTPIPATFAMGAKQQFTATATYSNGTTANITSQATWSIANTSVATITSAGLASGVASGTSTVTATSLGVSGSAPISVTIAPGTAVNVSTWHFDNNRSGLNAGETSLTPGNVSPQTFGKLFSYLVDGYAYAEPLLVSNVTIDGAVHNVLYVATENDSVYAFDADNYGNGTPLWQVSLLRPASPTQSAETPQTNDPDMQPYKGITSTPVIDTATNTMYVVSTQTSSSGSTFRLNALDITTGAQKFNGPITIQASVPGANSDAVNGIVSLTTSCIQRSALLLANGNIYIGFGGCHSGWLLAYNATTLAQVGVFNSSPNLDGEGQYASAGGVWMGSGGPVADSSGNVYVVTGNGPWDGQTAFADSVLKFSPTLQLLDYFTPDDYAYMDCRDADLAAGGLLLIPGTTQLLAGGKTGKLYMVNSTSLGHEQANDAGATQTLWFESSLSSPYSSSCGAYSTEANSYEIFGTAAYFNGSVYLGITPTSSATPAGIGQFSYSSSPAPSLTPGMYSSPSIQENTRGTTPFISANGTSDGILWMIDEGQPIQSPLASTNATLRAYDVNNLSNELYSSSANPGDVPGYGLKFTSPIVANGKVYISTAHDLLTATNPRGEIDVYGLK